MIERATHEGGETRSVIPLPKCFQFIFGLGLGSAYALADQLVRPLFAWTLGGPVFYRTIGIKLPFGGCSRRGARSTALHAGQVSSSSCVQDSKGDSALAPDVSRIGGDRIRDPAVETPHRPPASSAAAGLPASLALVGNFRPDVRAGRSVSQLTAKQRRRKR
jgi:hypothetical protein